MLDGRVTKKASYFKAFGSTAALFEVILKIGSRKERLDAIAKVIAECDGEVSFRCIIICTNFDHISMS